MNPFTSRVKVKILRPEWRDWNWIFSDTSDKSLVFPDSADRGNVRNRLDRKKLTATGATEWKLTATGASDEKLTANGAIEENLMEIGAIEEELTEIGEKRLETFFSKEFDAVKTD